VTARDDLAGHVRDVLSHPVTAMNPLEAIHIRVEAILAAADEYRADGLREFAAELDQSAGAMLVITASMSGKLRVPSIAEVYGAAAKRARSLAEGKP
jgi:hypothetical protein